MLLHDLFATNYSGGSSLEQLSELSLEQLKCNISFADLGLLLHSIFRGEVTFAIDVAEWFTEVKLCFDELDEQALVARLAWEYPLDGTTLLKDVVQIRPGTVEVWKLDSTGRAYLSDRATIESQKIDPASDWNPERDAGNLLETFVEGVSERLMSDVPVGIVLSGGLDSSLVAAVAHEAAERAEQPVPACWTVAESEDNPDWMAAEEVASSFDLVHHQHILESSCNLIRYLCAKVTSTNFVSYSMEIS